MAGPVNAGFIRCLKDGQMDFVGQAKALNIATVLLWVCGVVGFIYGFITERFLNTFIVVFGGFLLSVVICVPSWPAFNRNRLAFQSSKPLAANKKD